MCELFIEIIPTMRQKLKAFAVLHLPERVLTWLTPALNAYQRHFCISEMTTFLLPYLISESANEKNHVY